MDAEQLEAYVNTARRFGASIDEIQAELKNVPHEHVMSMLGLYCYACRANMDLPPSRYKTCERCGGHGTVFA